MNKNSQYIGGVDLVRAFCAIGIIVFHFFCHSSFHNTWLTDSANIDHGSLFVYIFFIVSGLCLYKSNYDVNVTTFFSKRWKSIFPSFYIAYFIFFLIRGFFSHNFNPDNASLVSFILTLLGVDGYFSYLVPTFYVLGEWFLGAIIILYFLYPLVLFLFKKIPVVLLVTLLILSVVIEELSLFTVLPIRNIICCLTGFCIGMFLSKNKKLLDNSVFVAISFALSVLVLLFRVNTFIPTIIVVFVLCTATFVWLRWLGDKKTTGGAILQGFRMKYF